MERRSTPWSARRRGDRRRLLARATLALLAVAAAACGVDEPPVAAPPVATPPVATPPARLAVAAAASLQELLESTAPAFERAHPGTTLVFSFAASSALSRQIEAAAGFDAFLSADAANVDRLGERIDRATRVEFLGNELVVVARAGLAPVPTRAADLASLPGRIAVAAESVPAGKYARAWLAKVGLLETLRPKLVDAEHVRAALAWVENATADAAIVYATDARVAKRATVAFRVAAADDPGIVYVAAAGSARPTLAADYVRFLRAAEFADAARGAGFRVPEP